MSLLPPLLAIGLAIWTRQVYLSLAAGTFGLTALLDAASGPAVALRADMEAGTLVEWLVAPGDTVTVTLEVMDKQERRKVVVLDCRASNQAGKLVATGSAEVIAPAQKLSIERPPLPRVEVLSQP